MEHVIIALVFSALSFSSTKTQTVLPTVDDDAVQRAVEDVAAAVAHQEAEPQVQHFMSHDLAHRESVRHQNFPSLFFF